MGKVVQTHVVQKEMVEIAGLLRMATLLMMRMGALSALMPGLTWAAALKRRMGTGRVAGLMQRGELWCVLMGKIWFAVNAHLTSGECSRM